MSRSVASAREREPDTYVPFLGHAAPGVMLLDNGDQLAMLHIGGIAWETADLDAVNARHARLNVTLRNIASDRLVLSSHIVRTIPADGAEYPAATCRSRFAAALDDGYRAALLRRGLFRNDLYLSVLLRPSQAAGSRMAGWLHRRRRGDTARSSAPQDTDRLEAVVATLQADLQDYEPRRLGLRANRAGVLFSEIGETLRLILTGRREPVPLLTGHLGSAIYSDRVICGREAIEIRGPGRSTFAAGFGLREYPATTMPGMFDTLLGAPYRFVLSQSFGFLGKQAAQSIMTRKQNQMTTAGDKATSQTAALSDAADLLHSNAFVMGDHHLTLLVMADSLDDLAEIAPQARRDLAESGAAVTREDWGLEAVYWGQLPGNLHLRSRPGAISSRNFAAMAAMHNYPLGPARGHWGEPLTVFRTTGGTPFRFHLHASTGLVTDLGNIFVAGPAGSGKTTLVLFLLAMAEKQDATVVFFDKDRGGEILARALGGTYLVLPSGSPTGLAPLRALDGSPRNIEFLKHLVTSLVTQDGKPLTPDLDRRLDQGLRQMMTLPPEHRSLGELRAFLGQSDADGIGARLDRWCKGGSLGWVLDNDEDTVSTDARFVGFDMTAVLDDKTTRGPVMAYLFHRVEAMVDGRRLIVAIDEFWKALADPGFRDVVNDKLKTVRKQNGAVILATQSPADALRSPIAHSIIEQCPTQILLPNDRADEADYIDGLKLTPAEFQAVREDLTQGGRRFLLKQGNISVACGLDLTGMEDFVAVLSGRARTVRLMERLIVRHGASAHAWLPHFMRDWREAAA
ncbi:MAG: VirB4 family type IV secretion system protein [Bradyrhizobium sp.]